MPDDPALARFQGPVSNRRVMKEIDHSRDKVIELPRSEMGQDGSCEREPVVWISIALEPAVLRHYLQFPDPNAAMQEALGCRAEAGYALDRDGAGAMEQSPGQALKSEALGAENESAWEEIRRILGAAEKSVEGYGAIRRAAEAAHKHFGLAWLNPRLGTPDHRIRQRLRKLLKDTLPQEHTNISVPWKRFQDYAEKHGASAHGGQ